MNKQCTRCNHHRHNFCLLYNVVTLKLWSLPQQKKDGEKSLEMASCMSFKRHWRMTFHRAVRQERNLPPLPLNCTAIPVLPHQYQVTENGDQFLLFDSGVGDAERILLFSSQQGLQFLSNSQHWYADGTFKVCPEVFFQVYTVHAQQGGRIFPCSFALLPNKTEGTYTRLFRELFNHVNGNSPDGILVDFERSAISALHNVNQQLEIKGCFYHLCSNVWKHIQNLGIKCATIKIRSLPCTLE